MDNIPQPIRPPAETATPAQRGRTNTTAPDAARAGAGRYFVPSSHEEWRALASRAAEYAKANQLIAPIPLEDLKHHAAALASSAGLPASYREFLLILLNNELWRDMVAAIPFKRRTLLLPPCLRAADQCTAEFDEFGLLCNRCGSCAIGHLSDEAEALGYAVVVAEGTSIVTDLIRQGLIDAVIGVSCMPSLERTFPHIFAEAIPGLAFPLLEEGCNSTAANLDGVRHALHIAQPGTNARFIDLKRLHREVESWFTTGNLRPLFPQEAASVAQIAFEWCALSGKRWRPFLATAVYEALRTDPGHPLPDTVKRIAIGLECLHKASLVCDDIQDDDDTRYGERTLHRAYGMPVGLTAGLYLIGLGYKLIATCAPPEQCANMLAVATEGHCDLCHGQGTELLWMRRPVPLTSAEVLDFFRWKTAPSFEVVFRLGAIAGGANTLEHEVITKYSHAMGIAYQIKDDLQDIGKSGNADDIQSGRPSILMALAHEAAQGPDRDLITRVWFKQTQAGEVDAVRALISALQIEDRARELLVRYKREAIDTLKPLQNANLKVLLHRLASIIFRDS